MQSAVAARWCVDATNSRERLGRAHLSRGQRLAFAHAAVGRLANACRIVLPAYEHTAAITSTSPRVLVVFIAGCGGIRPLASARYDLNVEEWLRVIRDGEDTRQVCWARRDTPQ